MSIKSRGLRLGLVALLVISTSGCALLPVEDNPLAPPLVEPLKERLDLYEVKRQPIKRQVRGTASFEPVRVEYHQFIGNSGRVSAVHVSQGDQVKKGDLLVELEMEGIDIQLKQRLLDVERAKRSLDQANESQNSRDIRIAKLELEITELQLKKTKAAYDSRQLKAQMSGQIIFKENLLPGDLIEAYQVLVSVADVSRMQLYYQVSGSRDISDIDVGMNAEVIYKGQQLNGVVVQTPSSAPRVKDQQLAEQYAKRLYIELEELPKDAAFGDIAEIQVTTSEKEDALVIPARGLRTYLGRNYVQVMDGESRQEADVELGIETATEMEIMKGLTEGQQIILK